MSVTSVQFREETDADPIFRIQIRTQFIKIKIRWLKLNLLKIVQKLRIDLTADSTTNSFRQKVMIEYSMLFWTRKLSCFIICWNGIGKNKIKIKKIHKNK